MNQQFNSYVGVTDCFGASIRFTPEGGLAIKLINNTGVPTVKGTIACPGVIDNSFALVTPSNETAAHAIGIVYEDGIPHGGLTWVVVAGIAEILCNWARQSLMRAGYQVVYSSILDGMPVVNYDRAASSTQSIFVDSFRQLGIAMETVDCSGGTPSPDGLYRLLLCLN